MSTESAERTDYERKHEFLIDFAYVLRNLDTGYIPDEYKEYDYLLLLGKRGYVRVDTLVCNFSLAFDFMPYLEDETIDDIINMVVEDQDNIKILLPDTNYTKNIPFYEMVAEKMQRARIQFK